MFYHLRNEDGVVSILKSSKFPFFEDVQETDFVCESYFEVNQSLPSIFGDRLKLVSPAYHQFYLKTDAPYQIDDAVASAALQEKWFVFQFSLKSIYCVSGPFINEENAKTVRSNFRLSPNYDSTVSDYRVWFIKDISRNFVIDRRS